MILTMTAALAPACSQMLTEARFCQKCIYHRKAVRIGERVRAEDTRVPVGLDAGHLPLGILRRRERTNFVDSYCVAVAARTILTRPVQLAVDPLNRPGGTSGGHVRNDGIQRMRSPVPA